MARGVGYSDWLHWFLKNAAIPFGAVYLAIRSLKRQNEIIFKSFFNALVQSDDTEAISTKLFTFWWKISLIDCHIHAVDALLPGSKGMPLFMNKGPEAIASALLGEMHESGINAALSMGTLATSREDPLGVHPVWQVADLVPNLYAIGIMDPRKIDHEHLEGVEHQLQSGKVKALKAFLGYLHYGPEHPNYLPYYSLAEKYDLPVIFHTGDTYSFTAKLKYAHPLLVDEVAVDHRQVNFVIAHVGNPWLVDAAQVVYKNENVWADLSGILVGDEQYFARLAANGELQHSARGIKDAIDYAECPERFMYGSDWPLAPMKAYLDFAELMIPSVHDREGIMDTNARRLFKI